MEILLSLLCAYLVGDRFGWEMGFAAWFALIVLAPNRPQ